jgi:hypothetical protein
MNRNVELAVFAITATVFAAAFLIGLLVLGNHLTRSLTLVTAFLACGSQFAGGNASSSPPSYKAALALAYLAFFAGVFALAAFMVQP